MVHHSGELRPIQDVLFQNVQQLHQLVRWNLQQDCTECDFVLQPRAENQITSSVVLNAKSCYPAGDAHGLDLCRLAAKLIQLVLPQQQFLRYLIIISWIRKT